MPELRTVPEEYASGAAALRRSEEQLRELLAGADAAGAGEGTAVATSVDALFHRAAGPLLLGIPHDTTHPLAGQGGVTWFRVHLFGRRLVGVVLLLVLDRAETAEAFLDAAGVVEAVDVLEEREVR